MANKNIYNIETIESFYHLLTSVSLWITSWQSFSNISNKNWHLTNLSKLQLTGDTFVRMFPNCDHKIKVRLD